MKTILIDDEYWAEEIFLCEVENNDKIEFVKRFTKPLPALQFIEDNIVELIFVDIEMPNLNGIEFKNNVHDINSEIKVIFLSVSEHLKDIYHNHDIIIKPYSNHDIQRVLKED